EVVVDVDAEPGPRQPLVLGRDLVGTAGQVSDVADAGLDHVARPEVARDRPRLGRRLDDHKALPRALCTGRCHCSPSSSRVALDPVPSVCSVRTPLRTPLPAPLWTPPGPTESERTTR